MGPAMGFLGGLALLPFGEAFCFLGGVLDVGRLREWDPALVLFVRRRERGLDEVRAGQRVDRVAHSGLVSDDLLGAQGGQGRLFSGQAEGLIH